MHSLNLINKINQSRKGCVAFNKLKRLEESCLVISEENGDHRTCDHQRRNLIISQSEFSIQRRSIGKMNRAAASKFGSRYMITAIIYKGGIPLTLSRNDSTSLIFPNEKELF